MVISSENSRFLRRILIVDAVFSGLAGLILLLGAVPAAEFLDLPVLMLRLSGAILVPFSALLVYLARRHRVSRAEIVGVIAANAAWVVLSVAVLFSAWIEPNRFGFALVLIQAIAVALVAEAEYVGLRKASV